MRILMCVTCIVCVAAACPSAMGNPGCAERGDHNGDCRIDLSDYRGFVACMTGPGATADPLCVCYDENADGDVDLADFRYLQEAFTGPDLIPGCDLTPPALEPGTLHVPPAAAAIKRGEGEVVKIYKETAAIPSGVYAFSGEYHLSAVDLLIPGRGIDFVWARKYRSKAGPTTAQGNGWDFGYNVYLESDGPDLILHDGNTRADRYVLVSGSAGTRWCAREFFREITQEPDTSYVCRFAHRGEWRFHPFDGSPQAGRLTAIVDANSNALTFAYDAAGRLAAVTDTLNRVIIVAYNPDGQIAAITDFAGRQVQYDYYTNADTNGAAGDLKSVTSPAVIGTPTGNDFPAGKTETYTYTAGFADEALNHNLLTITDAKGQTYLTNVYAATADPFDPDFDHVTRQVFGNPGDIIDYVYVPETPEAANNYAVSRAIVNDRNGHVDEFLYDKFNRCVVVREHTGQADPDLPTTAVDNRPAGKLRPGDPDLFETLFEYNDDSLLARVIGPELDEARLVYEGDLDFFAPPREKANLRSTTRTPGSRGGDQSAIVEEFEYDNGLSAGTNQVTRWVDGRGNQTLYEYDAAGNRTRTTHRDPTIVDEFEYNGSGQLTAQVHPDNGSGHRRRDEFTYYTAGPSTGYLHQSIVDAGAGLTDLTTTFEYDAVGNVTRVVDPRGNDALYTYNALDQVVRGESRPLVLPIGTVRYATSYFYDANDNVVRVDVENRDETGTLQPNGLLTTLYEYDILDRRVRTCAESGDHNVPLVPPQLDCTGLPASEFVTTEFEYDANGNRALVRSPEAVERRQPGNIVQFQYDERDLLFRQTRAPGTADQSTAQYDYDGAKNVGLYVSGIENAAGPRATQYEYDGYDRVVAATDPMANVSTYHYDANGNVTTSRTDGERDDQPGNAGNLRLSETIYVHDAMDWLFRVEESFFDPETQAPVDDGKNQARFFRSRSGHILMFDDDRGHATRFTYDTANRPETVTDAKGNIATYAYDANSNVTTVTETDRSDLGLPDETFVTTYEYDALDRRTRATDSVGNTDQYGYDSRDNVVTTIDAVSHGARRRYDSLDRPVEFVIDMDGDGPDGDGDDITTDQALDDNSRVVQKADDNGNSTAYLYDSLNRLTIRGFADGTAESYAYDVFDEKVLQQTANGSQVTYEYDGLGRLTRTLVTPGPGVSNDTTFETYAYDGMSRLIEAEDDDAIVSFTYDSLSNLTGQTLNGQTTSATYDAVGNMLACTYPGGRQITYTYDELNRADVVYEASSPIHQIDFVGGRVARYERANGVTTDFAYDGIQGVPNPPGDFGVKRVISTTHASGPVVIDARTYTWDPLYRKTQRADVRPGGPQDMHEYSYDHSHRLMRGRKTNSFGVTVRDTIYDLDGVGNRLSLSGFGGPTGPYVLDATLPQPADFQVNQYTQTHADTRQYDDNGNLIARSDAASLRQIDYDYADRIVAHTDLGTSDVVTYRYDPLGRRIATIVTPSGLPPVETRYYYGQRSNLYPFTKNFTVLEEQDDTGATQATYVYAHNDGVKFDFLDATGRVSMEAGGNDYYYHSDDLGNVMALTDSNGAVVERYEYGDYGAPQFFNSNGAPLAGSAIGNPYLFASQRYDAETGWYCFPARYLDPEAGRFVTRDPIGAWTDGSALGNAYSYAGNNPWTNTDPTGLLSLDGLPPGEPDYGCTCFLSYDSSHIWSWSDTRCRCRGGKGGGGGVRSKKLFVGGLSWGGPSGGGGGPLGIGGRGTVATGRIETRIAAGDPLKEETHFVEVTGLDVVIDTTEYQEGGALVPRKLPGPPRYSNIVLRRGATASKAFVDWVQKAASRQAMHTDRTGRVKVQFHWDREGKKDSNSSCWVRVSAPGAGGGPSGAIVSRTILKSYFQTGDKPTEAQFGNLIDSYIQRPDDGIGPLRWMAPEALRDRHYSSMQKARHDAMMAAIQNTR